MHLCLYPEITVKRRLDYHPKWIPARLKIASRCTKLSSNNLDDRLSSYPSALSTSNTFSLNSGNGPPLPFPPFPPFPPLPSPSSSIASTPSSSSLSSTSPSS
ncbi:unnamed protein product [Closterium sp. NIES-53]